MYEDEFELTFQVPEEESAPEPLAAPAAKPAAPMEPVADEPTRIMTLGKTAAPAVDEPTRVMVLEKPQPAPQPEMPEPVQEEPEKTPAPTVQAAANGRCVLISGGDRGIGAAAARAFAAAGYQVAVLYHQNAAAAAALEQQLPGCIAIQCDVASRASCELAFHAVEQAMGRVDVLVLVSHMGDDRDREFLSSNGDYDLLLSGHTHVVVDTLVGGTPLLQTGKELRNVGVTVLRLKGHRLVGVETRVVPLSDYEPAPEYEALVAEIYASPELNAPVGSLAKAADKQGLANWMAEAVADCADAEVGFYHVGGVRLDRVEKGAVSSATVYGLEPFGTHVAAMRMTPAQMRRMIVEKYNDTVNLKEAHRIDLIATTPYELVVDAEDRALDVRFPKLFEGRLHRVAMNDYIFRNYRALEYADGRILDDGVADVLLEELREDSPLHPDNEARQRVVRLGAGSR